MDQKEHYARLQTSFEALLNQLQASWRQRDIDYVRDELRHGEYGDALENLVAIGLDTGNRFDDEQLDVIRELARVMHLSDSPMLARLETAPVPAKAIPHP